MVVDKEERRPAGTARIHVEAGYAIEVDIMRVEDGSWGALVRLSKLADRGAPAAHFMLNRTFGDRAMAFSYTLALTRECVLQFAPAEAVAIARMLGTSQAPASGSSED
ncbi:hypothetical protein AB4Z48_02130 [Cupriavidus sp. 2TAF22]|uniref:hypothetical protein n=1 Tax=unclassified Cupriavidus TaxID=2640874 RepID=UPI003F912EFF